MCLPVLFHVANSWYFGEELRTCTQADATPQQCIEIWYLVAFWGLVHLENLMSFTVSSLALEHRGYVMHLIYYF